MDENTLPENRDDTRSASQGPAKALQLAISETEVRNYLGTYPSLDREAIVGAMIARGPWREDVERELRSIAGASGKPAQAGLSDRRLHAILQFIESSLHLPISVADMAAAVHLSPFHFSRAFTKTLGQPPHAFLTLRRIERAKGLIARGESSLTSIAKQVGYRTHTHFTGVFSRFVGMPPRRYRDMMSRRNEEHGDFSARL